MKRCPYCQNEVTPTKQFGIMTCPHCDNVVGIGDLIDDGDERD